jgi:mannose-1-phosphate guanylyltransferase/mannose-6-phosphate isomerase
MDTSFELSDSPSDAQARGSRAAASAAANAGLRPLPLVQVILAGGSGTRLWPVSRRQFPKQLVDMLGTASLLQTTAGRLKGACGERSVDAAPIVMCGAEHREMAVRQMEQLGVAPRVVVEPVSRGTAPALTLAALIASAGGDDTLLVVMPADHIVRDVAQFRQAVDKAARIAERGALVALGVRPSRPDTAYGYIGVADPVGEDVWEIDQFVEKPPLDAATGYLSTGRYMWNSGILVVRASVWLRAMERLQPAMHEACVLAHRLGATAPGCHHPDAQSFGRQPADSIGYAVMEHLSRHGEFTGAVVVLDAGWSDLESWDAVWKALTKDTEGNVTRGRVVLEGAASCYAHAESRLMACVGVTNLVVVETADALLVVDRTRVEDVKSVVGRIAALHAPEADAHRKVQRHWGCSDTLEKGTRFQVRRIIVHPGARLSLQLHHHRAEHWTVVQGTARVTRGDETFLLTENQSAYIPLGVKHRLENPGKLPLEIIEVQSGLCLGEEDIVRFEDGDGTAQ